MAKENVREYDSDAFTSLWMLQNVCKNYDILRFKEIPELKYVLNKPYVHIYSSTAISSEEATNFVSYSHEGRKVLRSEKINPTKTVERPFVILIILNPLEKNGLCYLSEHVSVFFFLILMYVVYFGKYKLMYTIVNANHQDT